MRLFPDPRDKEFYDCRTRFWTFRSKMRRRVIMIVAITVTPGGSEGDGEHRPRSRLL